MNKAPNKKIQGQNKIGIVKSQMELKTKVLRNT